MSELNDEAKAIRQEYISSHVNRKIGFREGDATAEQIERWENEAAEWWANRWPALAALPHREGATPVAEKLAIAAALKDHEFMARGGPGAEVFGCRCGVEFDEPGYDGYWEDPLHLHFADVLAAAGVFREGATPAIDREALERLIAHWSYDGSGLQSWQEGGGPDPYEAGLDDAATALRKLLDGAS